jgi:hypothetical protein
MRLLRAELTKLGRPLTWWLAVAAVVASLAFAWQGARNASSAAGPTRPAAARTRTCADFALPPGPLCAAAVSVQEQVDDYHLQVAATGPSSRHNGRPSDALPVEHPLGAGKLALGFMTSLGGAVVIFLLAAGHVAGEWDGRTIRTVLCQDGRRWPFLAAKAASLWIVALALVVVDWAALAALSPLLKSAFPLPGPGLGWAAAWTSIAADLARAPLVLAVFAVAGVAASVILRHALGAFALAGGVLVASLTAAGNIAALAPWTLAYWVAGWMQFRSHGYVIYHFWVDGFPASVHAPGSVTGFGGLLGALVVTGAASVLVLRRADIAS